MNESQKSKALILSVSAIVLILMSILFVMIYGFQKDKYNLEEVLYITKSIQVEESEQRSRYNQMMIRILTVHSFKYSEKNKRCMSKEQKIEYIRFNYKCATTLQFGLYDVPTIHLMENNFDPYTPGDYGEEGMGQVKFPTALFCYSLINFMPNKYRNLLRFNLKTAKDLQDPIIALKVAYILLWWERRQFRGREDWYISIYHWGGFLAKRWDKGRGEVPVEFTLNGKPYNVFKYYVTFKEFKTAFEMGMLEASIPIERKWRANRKKRIKEEIDFRKTKNIIRNLRKKNASVEYANAEHIKEKKEYKELLWKSNKDLKKIAGIVRKGGGVEKLREGTKRVVKNLLKKIKYKDQSKVIQITIISVCVLIISLILTMSIYGIITLIKKLKPRKKNV